MLRSAGNGFAVYVAQKQVKLRAVFEHVTVANGGTAPITECYELELTIAGNSGTNSRCSPR